MPDHIVKLFRISQRHRNEAAVCKFNISETNICCGQNFMFPCKIIKCFMGPKKKGRKKSGPQVDEVMVGPLGLSIPGCRKVVQLDLKENSMQNAGLLQHEYGIVS